MKKFTRYLKTNDENCQLKRVTGEHDSKRLTVSDREGRVDVTSGIDRDNPTKEEQDKDDKMDEFMQIFSPADKDFPSETNLYSLTLSILKMQVKYVQFKPNFWN